MWLAIGLVIGALELGPPWDDLELSERQQQRVSAVLIRYRPRIDALARDAAQATAQQRRQLKRRLAEVRAARDAEAAQLLSESQREHYEQIQLWIREGVPLGRDLFRSYEVSESGPTTDGVENPNRVRFSITNRGPATVSAIRLEVTFVDRDGAEAAHESVAIAQLEPGETRPVVVHYQYVRQWRQRSSDCHVRLLSAEPAE